MFVLYVYTIYYPTNLPAQNMYFYNGKTGKTKMK